MFKLTQIITSSPLMLYTLFTMIYFITFDIKYILFVILFLLFGIFLNIILKQIIKQPRPSNNNCGLYSDVYKSNSYGMPSQHVQIWTIFAMFWSIYLIRNCDSPQMGCGKTPGIGSMFSILLFWTLTIGVSIQRVQSKCHTISQVLVAFIVGIISSIIMYMILHFIKPQIFI